MSRFIDPSFPTEHPGVIRLEAAAQGARQLGRSLSQGQGLAALLLSAIVAAMLATAYQVMDSVAEGQLLVIWTAAWLVTFAALALLASAARAGLRRIKAGLDAWSVERARARAEQRLWAIARTDARVMADLRAAMARSSQSPAQR